MASNLKYSAVSTPAQPEIEPLLRLADEARDATIRELLAEVADLRAQASRLESVIDSLSFGACFFARNNLAAEVLNALYWDCALPRDRVRAHCDKGWVTLTGEVERTYQRSLAEADARRVRGVVGVTNTITVVATATVADESPKAALRAGIA